MQEEKVTFRRCRPTTWVLPTTSTPSCITASECIRVLLIDREPLHQRCPHSSDLRATFKMKVKTIYEGSDGRTSGLHALLIDRVDGLGTPHRHTSTQLLLVMRVRVCLFVSSSRYAFSKNGQPTIIARTNPNLNFGRATQMSQNDINRVNRLYQCSK